MTAALTDTTYRPASSSLTLAMRRVGPKPLRELLTFLTAATGPAQAVRYAGRMVVALDGTQIAVADTDANHVEFPKPTPGHNGPAGYPMIRMLALIQAGTRQLVDAVFGTDQISELAYAAQLTPVLTPGMLVLGDRNFSASTFLAQVADTGADFLMRGKTGTTAKKFPVLTRHPDGSYLSTTGTIPVRIIDAEVTITTEVGHRTAGYRLITSLLDPAEADARCLIELYHQRWEIETAYCDLKSTMLGGRVTRAGKWYWFSGYRVPGFCISGTGGDFLGFFDRRLAHSGRVSRIVKEGEPADDRLPVDIAVAA